MLVIPAEALQATISEMCAEFGRLTRLDVCTLEALGRRQALCFLRLEADDQERQLMTRLGACRFGDDVLLIVDLPPAGPRPTL